MDAVSSLPSKTNASDYCFYIPEGVGYVWVKELGSGNDGVVDLVRDCVKWQLYVRKKVRPFRMLNVHRNYEPDIAGQHHQPESSILRYHPNITQLIDWTEYRPLPMSHFNYLEWGNASSIQNFCNSGTLEDLINHYLKRRLVIWHPSEGAPCPFGHRECMKLHLCAPHDSNCGVRIPEAMIWRVFGSLVKAASFLHHVNPLIAHGDVQPFNVFLHHDASSKDKLPRCILGDWGKAIAFDTSPWDDYGRIKPGFEYRHFDRLSDFRLIVWTVKTLITLWLASSPDDMTVHEMFRDCETRDCPNMNHHVWDHATDSQGRPKNDQPLPASPPFADKDAPHWTKVQDKYDEDVNKPSAERLRRAIETRSYSYSAKLYATVRHFERMIERLEKNRGRPNWEAYGELLISMAETRMIPHVDSHEERKVLYPPVDPFFQQYVEDRMRAVNNTEWRYSKAAIRKAASSRRDEGKPSSGPWKIARVGRKDRKIKAFSKETYDIYGPPTSSSSSMRFSASNNSRFRSRRSTSLLNKRNL